MSYSIHKGIHDVILSSLFSDQNLLPWSHLLLPTLLMCLACQVYMSPSSQLAWSRAMLLTSVCSVTCYLLSLVFCLVGTNQQPCLGPRGFLGQRTFSAKTRRVPGKLGQLITLHAILIISLIHIFNRSTNTFCKLVTDWQPTWRGRCGRLVENLPLCSVHCSVNLFPLEGGLCFCLFQSSLNPSIISRFLLFCKINSRCWWLAYKSDLDLT